LKSERAVISSRTAFLYLIIAAFLWSTSGGFLKSLPEVHWLAIAGFRSLFAAILFLPGFFQSRPPARLLIGAGALYCVMVASLMGAMQLGTAAQGIWLQFIAPALIALWTWRVQKQKLNFGEIVAVLLTALAVGLIVSGGHGTQHLYSIVLGIISGFAFASFILLLKSLSDYPPAGVLLWTNLSAFVLLFPFMLGLHVGLPHAPREWGLLAAMGLGQLAFPYYFFQRGLIRTRAVDASLIVLLEPILNPLWAFLAVGEMPTNRTIIACCMIGVGLIIFALAGLREGVNGEKEELTK
jgi:drug/metabolite transporter, DME family